MVSRQEKEQINLIQSTAASSDFGVKHFGAWTQIILFYCTVL